MPGKSYGVRLSDELVDHYTDIANEYAKKTGDGRTGVATVFQDLAAILVDNPAILRDLLKLDDGRQNQFPKDSTNR